MGWALGARQGEPRVSSRGAFLGQPNPTLDPQRWEWVSFWAGPRLLLMGHASLPTPFPTSIHLPGMANRVLWRAGGYGLGARFASCLLAV